MYVGEAVEGDAEDGVNVVGLTVGTLDGTAPGESVVLSDV